MNGDAEQSSGHLSRMEDEEERRKQREDDDSHVALYVSHQLERVRSNEPVFEEGDELEAQLDD